MPKISRKISACTECQTRKIKCDVSPPERSVCTRCGKKGLRCVVNKSLQTLLLEETEWKLSTEQAVSKILNVLDLPSLQSFSIPTRSAQTVTPEAIAERLEPFGDGQRHARAARMAMTRENSQEPESAKMHEAIVSAPMGSLYEVTKLRNLRSNPSRPPGPTVLEDDLISRGKVSELDAEELFTMFSRSLNHYLWGGIALVHSTLESVRKSSSLLLSALLTVAALHIPGREQIFDICYADFITLVSDSMFERYHSLDGIRGLCIGAFWLSDVSWKLSGHAVRIATELNLHQSYSRVMRGSHEHLEGARLWYFLYVCDHHFSIAYGRPPVIHEDGTISNHEKFLQLPGISQSDLRLHSQVSIFIILTRVYNPFGPDVERVLADEELIHLRHFIMALDNWRIKWQPQLAPNAFVSTYPAKGVELHRNFGKLQISSLALRGFEKLTANSLTTERRELANTAINSASATLQHVLEEPDMRNSVVGVPIYLHTMLTYCSVFLLKVQQKCKHFQLGIDPVLVTTLVKRVIGLLNEVETGERHLAGHIAAGLSKMLDRFDAREVSELPDPNIPGQLLLQRAHHVGGYESANGFGINPGNEGFGLYDNSLPFFDDNLFPTGFFDVLATTHFDTMQRP